MRILLVGSGGREHALAWKLKQSPLCRELFIAPGNPGMAGLGTLLPIAADDITALVRWCKEQRPDLVVVGPEIPLTLGLVDELAAIGVRAWGPSKAAARLEGSKVEMKEFLRRYNIPTAPFRVFTTAAAAHEHIEEVGAPIVVKCDGLAAGKGVTVAQTLAEAHDAVESMMVQKVFGAAAGSRVVLEDVLRGEEISVFALCDGHNAVLLDLSQDHKQVNDGDTGPNTGGMGAFSPAPGLLKPKHEDDVVRRIVVPTLSGLAREGRPYVGVLYMGLMITEGGPKVIEYNVRFGDPECQVLMLRLESDLVELCLACLDGKLDQIETSWKPQTAIVVTMASGGYPVKHSNGFPITGFDAPAAQQAMVFHAGTASKDGQVVTNGGRVLSVCALGDNIDAARATAYAACDAIQFNGKHYRSDIGKRAEARAQRKG